MNKNKLKYLAIFIPLAVIWGSFGLGHLLNMNSDVWWAIPYMLTSIITFISSVMFAGGILEKNYDRPPR